MDRHEFCRALARDAGKLVHRAFGTSATSMKGRHDVVTAMDREVERTIRAGSGALGLADVAAGRAEAYCELHINAWDCAAGIVLVREAGGFTNDFFAGNGIAKGNPLIATNALLRDEMVGVIGIAVTA